MKTTATILLLLCFVTTRSQQKKFFFDDVYVSGMAGNQVYQTDMKEWKNMYAGRTAIPYLLDTMKSAFIPKDGPFLRINARGAMSVILARSLVNRSRGWMRNKKLEWRTGLYYKTTMYNPGSSGFVTTHDYPADTTKTHTVDHVLLQQSKQQMEWQNLINFKTGPFLYDLLRFNIGSGIGVSRTVKNSIHENYYQTIYTWSTAQHRFLEQSTAPAENDFKAKPETSLSYIFYLGTELKLSSQMSMLGDFHYTIAHYKYSSLSPKIESYWLGLTFRYGLNQ